MYPAGCHVDIQAYNGGTLLHKPKPYLHPIQLIGKDHVDDSEQLDESEPTITSKYTSTTPAAPPAIPTLSEALD